MAYPGRENAGGLEPAQLANREDIGQMLHLADSAGAKDSKDAW